uniref:ATP synthase F0 subunit 8 n=1 Tax=Rivularia auriculata TaxID=2023863 RepID=A0A7G6KRE1_9CAEN|nr:ATP synthase F0 subunit 8 [Rivularia auriculata]YP_010486351.1 ATP synthase F0 subunit 8 [Rivularia globosa]QNC70801.1 ATP synthase F0 subunit 8 [Rivularia auriculata]UVW93507.1 ATP synthase F0 subunit 8 [Rivularia globosa]UVW93520.1 ATP synthase F0 subunit 8 [Rivularia globosa]UVW93546.1 ATP synthase F0 subunit 8 [Rivularia auriculata]
MPQLSPLNWILLFLIFWVVVLLVFVLIWWEQKIDFSAMSKGDCDVFDVSYSENKWEW